MTRTSILRGNQLPTRHCRLFPNLNGLPPVKSAGQRSKREIGVVDAARERAIADFRSNHFWKCNRAIDQHRWQSHQVDIAAAGEGHGATQRGKGDHLSRPDFALNCGNGRSGRIQTDGHRQKTINIQNRSMFHRPAASRPNSLPRIGFAYFFPCSPT